ncbi:MAG TPA: 30S ribosomal protein S17 [Candidatus Atribacteria bacterium]|jgi:small subunit ribosomal protein S17|uniref:30S ribosomal protein S17 n=1 Tax=Candidatus Sordicultor fermentans TaxID=1953203 RepID=UPI0016BC673F|nr:30S ribosomal protein S17 [Atribacterota bacterium]NLY06181.1 30S ribosomal protein S17 [Candidatus Atribacteria bacterium]MDY0134864.1 30S ribosomal protein S17 [Atribacterota bacterium]HOA98728.1 30S ribosomal protein S17 [Candidatus Atribacteria bacterium]HOQ50578.1 30S ribosomal protein S17 [Candidatus Atribacteria bacterium]
MGARKRLTGEVVSNAMDKTVVVKVVRISEHPLYRKKIRKASRFSAHDENGICAVGDRVLIEETRPLSKTKRWRVVTVLQKARVEGGEEVDSVENYA